METGSAVNLLKGSSKRKRTRKELEEVKHEEEALKEDKQEFLKEMKRLKEENHRLSAMLVAPGGDSKMRPPSLTSASSRSSLGASNN